MGMEKLFDDLFPGILLRLPIKSLVRFKCVKKKFNQIISDPMFATDYALRSPHQVQGFFHFTPRNPREIFYLSLHSRCEANTQGLSLPILASCNGLLLLNLSGFLSVYNPTTKKHKFVRRPEYWSLSNKRSLGLVYDPIVFSSHHYKLVFVYSEEEECGFMIFSSDTHSWRKSNPKLGILWSDFFMQGHQATYLNGSLHWIKRSGEIIAFDLKKEEARIIDKPQLGRFEFKYMMWFGVVRGFINLVSVSGVEVAIWVLHDYENGKWGCVRNLVASLAFENDFNSIFYDGELLVLQSPKNLGEIYTYNMRLNEWRKIGKVKSARDALRVYIPFIPTLAYVNHAADDEFYKENYLGSGFKPVISRKNMKKKKRKLVLIN